MGEVLRPVFWLAGFALHLLWRLAWRFRDYTIGVVIGVVIYSAIT